MPDERPIVEQKCPFGKVAPDEPPYGCIRKPEGATLCVMKFCYECELNPTINECQVVA